MWTCSSGPRRGSRALRSPHLKWTRPGADGFYTCKERNDRAFGRSCKPP